MKDHYSTLGVARNAAHADIKQAYRRLASQHHPDKGGDTARFQEIEQAYRVLCDPVARQEYDNPRPQAQFHASGFNLDEIFNMFGTRFHQEQRRATASLQLWVTLTDLARPGSKVIAVSSPHGQSKIEIHIPPGLADGDSIRYPRLAPGQQDLVITYRIRPDPDWQRDGAHVITERAIDVWQAILGGDITMRTLTGTEISVTIPPRTQNGTMLRVRGHGLPTRDTDTPGDMIVRVQLRLPDHIPDDLLALIQRAAEK